MSGEKRVVRRGGDYNSHFHPDTYLSLYETPYGPEAAGDWGKNMTEHWQQAFSGVGGDRLVDLGCGPVLSTVIPASRYFSQIYLADFATCNRQAIQNWVYRRPGAHNWTPFFKYWADYENQGHSWQEIENRLRDALKGVMFCDVLRENPLAPETMTSFDCVMTNLCLEAVAPTEEVYRQEVKNVVSLLRPGGRLLMSGALNQTEYYVGTEVFYCLSVKESLLRSAVEESGCTIEELVVHNVSPEQVAEFADCSAYFFLKATKAK